MKTDIKTQMAAEPAEKMLTELEAKYPLAAARGSDAEALARQIAYIIGPSSAAQSAINELERKRRTGQPAYIHKVGNSWIVQTVRPKTELCHERDDTSPNPQA